LRACRQSVDESARRSDTARLMNRRIRSRCSSGRASHHDVSRSEPGWPAPRR
jgi:hypothetical protein